MALKKRISYHWRLFLPLAILIALITGTVIYYQYRHETEYREERIKNELELINNRILYAYQHNQDLREILRFFNTFFLNSVFEDVRISVYDGNNVLLYSRGTPVSPELEDTSFKRINSARDVNGDDLEAETDQYYYISSLTSHDGEMMVKTALPYSEDVDNAVEIDKDIWFVLILLIVITLSITFIYTYSISKSIRMLNEFAQKAASGLNVEDDYEFPHNELGDISRQIITLYNERGKAVEMIERERKVALHAIEERITTSRQITNNINHEIKTPVGIIKGYLETIIATPDMDPDSRKRFMERMLLNVDRLCNLLNDVSTMTRLENGGGKIPLERVDMHDMVYQIDSDLQASHIAGDMTFSYSIPFDCNVKGNFNLLTGMINGLIRNSAMHSGGTEMGLKLISESDRFYVFSFYDNGNGVGDEHLSHLFERFYRVDTGRSRKMGGTGLGLPIVKSTVLSLGGTISVHNRSTGGLEFIFTLPKWEA